MISNLVSVIIPAYNQGNYLGKAIESVLCQTYQNFEIIVVDDGSKDNTASVVKKYLAPNIHYIYQENRGLSSARNTGLRAAQGEFLTYLDSDDLFLPEKMNLLVAALKKNPDWGMVAGQAIPINENDQPIGKIYDTSIPEPVELLILGNPLHVGSVLVRQTWQAKTGEFDESLRSYEDWDMWLRMAKFGCRMGWVPSPVSLYRFHTAQMTRIGNQMTEATFAVLEKFYKDPFLSSSWIELRNQAYSNAYLRAMAQAYNAEDYSQAKDYLVQAIQVYPQLVANHAQELSQKLSALANSPKILNPLEFLTGIYNNLPHELNELFARKSHHLGDFAMDMAFESYSCQDYQTTRKYIMQALRFNPLWLKNRGVLSVLVKAYTRPVFETLFG